MKDIITIIIPCYNTEKYIYRCLRSIEKQTYGFENLEIILVEDCSSDNTASLLKAFCDKYPHNTILIQNKQNKGSGYARNIGIEIASGKYISFVDSDDVLAESAIERMHEKAVEYNCEVVRGGYQICSKIEDFKVTTGDGSYFSDLTDDGARKNLIISTVKCYIWGMLFSREALVKYNIKCPVGKVYQDMAFTLLWMVYLNSYYYLDETVYCYNVNEESTTGGKFNSVRTRDFANSIGWAIDVIKKNKDKKKWENLQYEIEAFYLWNAYFQPVNEVLHEIDWYKDEMLRRFPNVQSSPYVTNITDGYSKHMLSYLN